MTTSTASRVFVAALLFSATAPSILAQEAGLEPIPGRSVADGKLSIPAENFSVMAPGKGWEWLRQKPAAGAIARNYLCRNPETGEVFFLTVSDRAPRQVENLAEGLLTGMRKSQEAKGRRVENARSEPSDVPAPGSYRLSATVVLPERTIHFISYALATDRVYSLSVYSEEEKEPEAFTRFARSFALLAAAAEPPKGSVSERCVAICLYVGALVLFLGVGSLINALAKRPVFSGGLIAFIVILVIATLRLAGVVATKPDPESIGYVVGEALVPALIAAWAHSRYTKRKQATPSRP